MSKKKMLEQLLENTRKYLSDDEHFESDLMKVILPLIPNAVPNGMIDDMVRSQTLSTYPMSTGTLDCDGTTWYWVSPAVDLTLPWESIVQRNNDINDWTDKTFGPMGDWSYTGRRWWASDCKYYFKNEHDRTMFVLRWS